MSRLCKGFDSVNTMSSTVKKLCLRQCKYFDSVKTKSSTVQRIKTVSINHPRVRRLTTWPSRLMQAGYLSSGYGSFLIAQPHTRVTGEAGCPCWLHTSSGDSQLAKGLCVRGRKAVVTNLILRISHRPQRIQSDTLELRKTCSCLLYTSPSPRDMYKSRMPSSA